MATSTQRGRGRPPGPPVDLDARRERLLDAAESAIRASGPAAGLADVATVAGLTRSAVYAAFADRDALIDALAERHAERIVDQIQGIVRGLSDPREQTRACVDILAAWYDEEPHLANALSHSLTGVGNGSFLVDALAGVLKVGFELRGLESSPAEPWARGLIGAVSATVQWWAQTHSTSRTEVVDHLTSLIWSGFAGASEETRGNT